MWINNEEISRWAYYQCTKYDRPTIRNLICKSKWAYLYCKTINNSKEIASKIKNPYWAFKYCIDIEETQEKIEIIKKSSYWYWFDKIKKDKKEMKI